MAIELDDELQRPRDAAFFVETALDDLECADVDLNRIAARRAARIADAVALARRHAEVYVPEPGPHDVEYAERAAVLDIALRLKRSEDEVRSTLVMTEAAMAHLPQLWASARQGFASLQHVERTVAALRRVRAPGGATPAQLDAERRALREIDEATAQWARDCTMTAFRRRLRRLVARLATVKPEDRHTQAVMDRRVYIDHEDETGMSWLGAYLPTEEAIAALRRLDATARRMTKDAREERTRAQLRADLLSAWLRGEGTTTAVKTRVFVTIPVQLLTGSDMTVLPHQEAEIVGHGPIDPLTAEQILLDAGAFRRVIVDPIRSVVLDMDRRSRRATEAQRDWLVLQHGTCARDGCDRSPGGGCRDRSRTTMVPRRQDRHRRVASAVPARSCAPAPHPDALSKPSRSQCPGRHPDRVLLHGRAAVLSKGPHGTDRCRAGERRAWPRSRAPVSESSPVSESRPVPESAPSRNRPRSIPAPFPPHPRPVPSQTRPSRPG